MHTDVHDAILYMFECPIPVPPCCVSYARVGFRLTWQEDVMGQTAEIGLVRFWLNDDIQEGVSTPRLPGGCSPANTDDATAE